MHEGHGFNTHKLFYHPRRVADVLGAAGDWERGLGIYPLSVEISPVGACNHRCLFCGVDHIGYKPDRLDLGIMRERLPELAVLGVRSVCFSGEGEPLLHEHIGPMLSVAKACGLDVGLVTNGSVLPPGFLETGLSALSWLKVSVNAGSPETYALCHGTDGGDFEKVFGHMAALVRARREGSLGCALGVQALLLPENFHEMEVLVHRCRDVGMDFLVVKPYFHNPSSITQRYRDIDYRHFADLGERLQSLSGPDFLVVFRAMAGRFSLGGKSYSRCYVTPYLRAYVMASGAVSGCSAHLLNPDFEYGNINERGFAEIWQGERRRAGLKMIHETFDVHVCRQRCPVDDVNGYLYAIDTQAPPHINFI